MKRKYQILSLKIFGASEGAKVASTFEGLTTVLTFLVMLLTAHLLTHHLLL